MKTLTKFKSKWKFMVPIIFLLPLLGGCQEEGLPDEEGAEVPLSWVPDNPDYASLPLIGTQWKLIGFVDGKRNRIRLAKPGGGDSFTQIFEDNNTFSGRASVNLAQGEYILTNNQLSMPEYHLRTYALEKYDGPLYIASMEKVFACRISRKGLELYYDSNQYLLFRPVE